MKKKSLINPFKIYNKFVSVFSNYKSSRYYSQLTNYSFATKECKYITDYIPKGKVLDIACARGRYTKMLNVLGYDVWGIDITRQSEWDAKFRVADATQLPYKDGTFDGAIIIASLQYMDDGKALSETNRVLRQNGKVVVTVPNANHLRRKIYGSFLVDDGRLREYTKQGIVNMLEKSGFYIDCIYSDTIYFPIGTYIFNTLIPQNINKKLSRLLCEDKRGVWHVFARKVK